jgi:Beta protein
MQASLFKPDPLSPLPVDSRHYVPAVQNKKGELDALRTASATTWERMTPLIHLVGPLEKRTDPFSSSTVGAWLKRVAAAVGAHPVYLDVMRLNPSFPVAKNRNSVPVLREIYAAAHKRGIDFVPVVWVSESDKPHVEMVADEANEARQGVALRYRFLSVALPAGKTRAQMVKDLLSRLNCEATSADLLLDLQYLDPDHDYNADTLAASIKELAGVGAWRSIVTLGTSMPSTLSCIDEGTVGSLPRQEWNLWTQLRGCGLARQPAFGDYAVQHPLPPAGGGPGMRANIRYTIKTETVIARGRGSILQEGNEQYRDLCQQLTARPEYSGRDYTWGDEAIDDCAKGAIEPGSQNLWRGAGTSHHLRLVTDQLRQEH